MVTLYNSSATPSEMFCKCANDSTETTIGNTSVSSTIQAHHKIQEISGEETLNGRVIF